MKRILLPVLMLAVVVGVPSLLAGKGDASSGQALFAKKCATCHGAKGEGKPAIAKMMKVEMHDFASKEVQSKTDAQLTEIIKKGTGKMKPVAGLKDADVENLVAFIRSLAKK